MLICFIKWLSTPVGDNRAMLQHMSRFDANSFQSCCILCLPYFEGIFLLAMLLTGLNKIDIYHMVYLFLFVCYLCAKQSTRRPNLYGFLFFSGAILLEKYVYTLIVSPEFADSKQGRIFRILGLSTTDFKRDSTDLFMYLIKPQQWATLIVVYL